MLITYIKLRNKCLPKKKYIYIEIASAQKFIKKLNYSKKKIIIIHKNSFYWKKKISKILPWNAKNKFSFQKLFIKL